MSFGERGIELKYCYEDQTFLCTFILSVIMYKQSLFKCSR